MTTFDQDGPEPGSTLAQVIADDLNERITLFFDDLVPEHLDGFSADEMVAAIAGHVALIVPAAYLRVLASKAP